MFFSGISSVESKRVDTFGAVVLAEELPEPAPGTPPGVLKVAGWERFSWLRHGFSTRAGGVSTVYSRSDGSGERVGDGVRSDSKSAAWGELNLGFTKEDLPAQVFENRRRFTESVYAPAVSGLSPALITLRQIHSNVSLLVAEQSGPEQSGAPFSRFLTPEGRAACEGDGLLTAMPGVLLGIQTADCVPVLVVDPHRRAVAGFHAGWRGTAARIVEQGIAQMCREFGSRAEDLLAAIGPSIGSCCYTVGEEALTQFRSNFSYAEDLFGPSPEDPSLRRLDLWEANRRQLLVAGVPAGQITVLGECTGCAGMPVGRRYFSHRCEQGRTGRMMSAIGIAGS